MSYFRDVFDFHARFELPKYGDPGTTPHLLDEDTLKFRREFLQEELLEFDDACKVGDLAKAADALVDLVYVALGTAHMMAIPFDACWAEVQRANMQKVRAASKDDGRSKRKHHFDVVKPEGWQPPNIAAILSRPLKAEAYVVEVRSGPAVLGEDWRPVACCGTVSEARRHSDLVPAGTPTRIRRYGTSEVLT